jgi:uncharacterized protein YbgA (DUF1722 family)/uncharacterized protein YbbK (DUF523 family)
LGSDDPRVRLGVSACLLGHAVRFDGGHKRNDFLTGTLDRYVEWVPVCPEEDAGFGTPREPMRLVQHGEDVRLVTVRSGRDVTDVLTRWAAARVPAFAALDLDGYVLKKDSPSCGLRRVKVYPEPSAGVPSRNGRGLFASALCASLALLPIEEEGRLSDPAIREHFIEQVYAHHRLRRQLRARPSPGTLVDFHTRHKLQLLAHSPAKYAELGRLVASAGPKATVEMVAEYGRVFMKALSTTATRGRHANVLQHAVGYFRDSLTGAARQDLASAIGDYQRALVPLAVPLRLIAHYARLHGVSYLTRQAYFDPYPAELVLRNQ